MLLSMDTTPLIAPLALSVAVFIGAICFLILANGMFSKATDTSSKVAIAFLLLYLRVVIISSAIFMGFLGFFVIIFS